ncbi:hypothetical protein EMEDMD4_440226 [Sinorhizobium medicae]|uniref:SDR family NAD(P)-dependent oxidoreductase n=1 Tax=Sinorhizobium medicae TaxID=110321 RepID=A0A508WZ59_9HYPH|nr:hypothetical protein EMEDMD4_440226 [Sinorhizobium medicae]
MRLRDDARIGILVNNAGTAIGGSFIEQSTDDMARLVALNTTALLRFAGAIAPPELRHPEEGQASQRQLFVPVHAGEWRSAGADRIADRSRDHSPRHRSDIPL